jgi:putative protease
MGNLESLAQRGYTEGFLRRHVHDSTRTTSAAIRCPSASSSMGELTGVRVDGLAEVKVKNRFAVGDHLELMTPRGNYHFDLHRLRPPAAGDRSGARRWPRGVPADPRTGVAGIRPADA